MPPRRRGPPRLEVLARGLRIQRGGPGTPGGGQPDEAAKAPEPGSDLAVDYDPDLGHAGAGVPRGGRPTLSDPRPPGAADLQRDPHDSRLVIAFRVNTG